MATTTNEKRLLILGEYVTNSSVNTIIKAIIEYNMQDDAIEKDTKNFERQPIVLVINCYGGNVYDGWALVGAIEMSGTPIITVAIGSVMSMALPIFLAGHTRLAHKRSTFVYHEIRGGMSGTLTDFKQGIEESDRVQNNYDSMVLEKTKIMKEQLLSVRDRKIDWFIPADEAMKLGIIDEVITEPVAWI
jgi:ATP-dependent Clp protease protease subunit